MQEGSRGADSGFIRDMSSRKLRYCCYCQELALNLPVPNREYGNALYKDQVGIIGRDYVP